MVDKARPILFSTPMVQQLPPRGQKTQTRRIIKPQYAERNNGEKIPLDIFSKECDLVFFAPYQPGDILWVRETWSFWPCWDCDNDCNAHRSWYNDDDGCFVYKAQKRKVPHEDKWRPSIFMPKEAARIFLRVTGVRAERLQDISDSDCRKEGIQIDYTWWSAENYRIHVAPEFIHAYQELWDTLNAKRDGGKYAWDKNPWVWVYNFEQIEKPAGWLNGKNS